MAFVPRSARTLRTPVLPAAVLTVVLAGMIFPGPAGAATISVSPDGTGDAATIQDALAVAVAGDVVELADGEYTGPGNRDIDFLGKAVEVRSASGDPALCVIRCQGSAITPRRGFLFHSGEGAGSVLRGVTITGGHQTDTATAGWGGAVSIDGSSSPVIENCVLTACQAYFGGGVWVGSGSSVTIRDTAFTLNTSTGGGTTAGGGIYTWGSADLIRCRFENNAGGAIQLSGPSSMTDCTVQGTTGVGSAVSVKDAVVRDCDFLDNSMTSSTFSGAGLYCSFSTLDLINCRFARNTANRSGGGVLLVSTTAAITDCVFEDNVAGTRGGGLHVNQGSTADIKDTLFRGNRSDGTGATNEGGGAVHVDFGSIVTFTSCTLVDNTAALKGGAVYLSGSSGAGTVMTRCTLVGNGSPTGGGINVSQAGPSTQIRNCIVAFGTEGGAMHCENGAAPTVSCSNFFGNAGGDAVCGADLVDNFSADPLFCFADAGDYSLQWGSPCLPANSDGCGLVGRRSFGGCNAVSVEDASWGSIKAGYRR